jgi:myo-inositol-1(or 4)-monophosphatase
LEELRTGAPLGKGAGGDVTHPVDKRAEDIIIEELQQLKIPVTLVSEECGRKDFFGGGPRLLVDPIDGSRNALTGVPLFSTSIALVDGDTVGDTVMGYVINLINGDEFAAEKGKGSFLNGSPIKTQSDDSMKVVAYETQVPRIDIPAIIPLLSMFNRARCFGSTALDLAFLAQGTLSVFVVPCPSRSFDFAAGYLLVKEAGGIVTDLKGESIDRVRIGVKKSTPLLAAANTTIHQKALCSFNNDPSVSYL